MPDSPIPPAEEELKSDLPSASFPSYTSILREHDVHSKQRETRIKLLKDLQKKEYNDGMTKNAEVMGSGLV